MTITFKRAQAGAAWNVYADGELRGQVWSGWNRMLASYWMHSAVPLERRRNPMQAWRTRGDAARALVGLPVEPKVPR
jgi:hypothetical protein